MGVSHSQRPSQILTKSLPHAVRSSSIKPSSKTASTLQSKKTHNKLNQVVLTNKLTQSSVEIPNQSFDPDQNKNRKRVSFAENANTQKRVRSCDHSLFVSQEELKPRSIKKTAQNQYFPPQRAAPKAQNPQTKIHMKNQYDSDQYALRSKNKKQNQKTLHKTQYKKSQEYNIVEERQLEQVFREKSSQKILYQYHSRDYRDYRGSEKYPQQKCSRVVPVIGHNMNEHGTMYCSIN